MEDDPPPADILDGFRLTGFFLARDLFGPHGQALPEARGAYLVEIAKRFGSTA
jgi:DNA repair protein RecO (recombination protein O)